MNDWVEKIKYRPGRMICLTPYLEQELNESRSLAQSYSVDEFTIAVFLLMHSS
jgi:hypothetical protein